MAEVLRLFSKKEVIDTDKIDTVIGKETEFKGNITAAGTIRVDGKMEGDLHNKGDVLIGETGCVAASIKARHVTVAGEVRGNIEAEGRLEIVPSGRVLGDIKIANLTIADGATFQGKCEMMRPDQNKVGRRPGIVPAMGQKQTVTGPGDSGG